jgi:hypothetical protein
MEDRYRSVEFIGLLSDLDRYYPPECSIRIILDTHSAHISEEPKAFLAQHPNRFQYVLAPKHGSWLNIVEALFGKWRALFRATSECSLWLNSKPEFCKVSPKSALLPWFTAGVSLKRFLVEKGDVIHRERDISVLLESSWLFQSHAFRNPEFEADLAK